MNLKPVKHYFTLTELLTVIAIIAALMGILLPGIARVRQQARITVAKSEIRSLQMAIQQYEQTFGYLPFVPETNDRVLNDNEYALLIGYLQGNNPRGLAMLEVQQEHGRGDWTDNTATASTWANDGYFYDPFPNNSVQQRYRVALDFNYDGKVDVGVDEDVHSNIAIWSQGPNRQTGDGGSHKEHITSWQR